MTYSEKTILSSSFGLVRSGLVDEKLLYPNGAFLPRREMKRKSKAAVELVALYKWISLKIESLSDFELNQHIANYNTQVKKLHDEYRIDEVVAGFTLLDRWLNDFGDKLTQTMLTRKLDIVMGYLTKGIEKHHEDGRTIARDSISSADNAYRLITGKAQLTKEMRDLKLQRWRNTVANHKKDKQDA